MKWTDTTYSSSQSGAVKFETFKLYISSICFYKNDTLVYHEENSFHLLNSDQPGSFEIPFQLPPDTHYNKLKFNIGIDSVTSVSGAMGGALDPANGMYWAWHSGYINAKLEGTSDLCKTAKREFQFHLGGYQQPYYCLQTKELEVLPTATIKVGIDLLHFMNATELSARDHIMSPCPEAMALSKTLHDSFVLLKK